MKRRFPLLLLFLLAIALAIILWPAPRSRRLALPGGGALELREVTYGTTHVYSQGGPRNRLLRLFPRRLRQKFGVKGPTLVVGTTNVALWMERDGADEVAFLICDNAGTGVVPEVSARMSSGSGNEFLEAWAFATFPRRQREFTVRVFMAPSGGEPGPLVGEWKVPNPAFRAYPVWTPEPLPATRSTGGLAVTLHELKTGVGWPRAGDSRYPVQFLDLCARAVVSFMQDGKPAEDWAPVSIETGDATGNLRGNTAWSLRSSNGWHIIHYQWGLWPAESAWKLKVELAQRANFPPDQLWTVRGLVLSETNLSLLAASRTNFQGEVVQLERLAPPKTPGGAHTLLLTVLPHREDFRFSIIEATDDLGRRAAIGGEGFRGASRTFDLKPAADAKSLDLTFALHPRRFVEFVVKPEVSDATNAALEFPSFSGSATNSP